MKPYLFAVISSVILSLSVSVLMAEDLITVSVQGSASARAELLEIHIQAESTAPIAVNAYNESLGKIGKDKQRIMELEFAGLILRQSMTKFAPPSGNPYGMDDGNDTPKGTVQVGIDLVVSLPITAEHSIEDLSSKIASLVDIANTEKVTFKKVDEYGMMQGLEANPVRFLLRDYQALQEHARTDAIKKAQSYVTSLRSAGIKVGKLKSMSNTAQQAGQEYAWMGMMADAYAQNQAVDEKLQITVTESLTFEFERLD